MCFDARDVEQKIACLWGWNEVQSTACLIFFVWKQNVKIFNTYDVWYNEDWPAYTCSLHRWFTFRDVVHFDEFLSLNVDQICKLISSDRLTVVTEEQVKGNNSLHPTESFSETDS